ncbi:hypothetical protein [Nocardia altamirensis]|uniref:hypothetical protein n=1 Tax=Nocardia altamirensis TaxID=472158 RepID=UPI00114D2FFB|nr:hypothetical protein [Nocardia altamirensis]
MSVSKRASVVLTALGAIAAAVALGAPQAGAVVTGIDITPTEAGCSYTVVAHADPGKAVVFFDADGTLEGTRDSFPKVSPTADESGRATTTWTPIKKGAHNIIAQEYLAGTPSHSVTVDTNANPRCNSQS